jgi:AcrR family transcriptional regulator
MGPIRREQICRAAASVIARQGFAGTTMRVVADEAAVSTGMVNHYFANRQALLTQTLVYVSERAQERFRRAIDPIPPGSERLCALLDLALGEDQEMADTWSVWINAYGEAVRLSELRHVIETRLARWYVLIDRALEGLVPPDPPEATRASWRFDAMLNGLMIQALTSEAVLDRAKIRDEVVRTMLPARVDGTARVATGSGRQ